MNKDELAAYTQAEKEFGEFLHNNYLGKWVATNGQELVCSGDSEEEVLAQLSEELRHKCRIMLIRGGLHGPLGDRRIDP